MKFEHELIPTNLAFPFTLFTFHAKDIKRIIPQHWHQSTEIIYCLSGALDVWVVGTHHRLKSGDILLINPNTVHATRSPVHNHVLCIQLPLNYLRQLTDNAFNQRFLFHLNTITDTTCDVAPLQNELDILCKMVEGEPTESQLADKIALQAHMLLFITPLVKNYSVPRIDSNDQASDDVLELMNAVTSYIDQHFTEKISLHETARHFHYSDSYFSRLFKHYFNMNFHDFLSSVRLNEAVDQLIATTDTIEEIAKACGFETYRNFYNLFCQVYQVTPREYRKSYE